MFQIVIMFEKFVLINGIITHLCLLGAAQGIFLFLMLLRRSKADKVFSIIGHQTGMTFALIGRACFILFVLRKIIVDFIKDIIL